MFIPPRALLSVYDKTGLVEFGHGLSELGFEILSTGGTAKHLREHDIPVTDVSDVTGHPEMFDGRVKTLHPAIHAPLLARLENENDLHELDASNYNPIQLLAVNLYAFSSAAAQQPPVDESTLLEMIDIGGPTLLRAAAKNHTNVLVICNPLRYPDILSELIANNGTSSSISVTKRRSLALEAYEHTASYDIAISNELRNRWQGDLQLPNRFQIDSEQHSHMRYGENPHQSAAFYSSPNSSSPNLTDIIVHSGKQLSYNNYVDLDSALRLARSLSSNDWPTTPHACIIVKHNNPCGVALSDTQSQSWKDALDSDPESAFGCIIAFNTQVTIETAKAIGDHFLECIIAPSYDFDAQEFLSSKKNRRILSLLNCGDRFPPQPPILAAKQVSGGWMLQTESVPKIDPKLARSVTSTKPSEEELSAMRFGIVVCEQVKSNSVIFVKGTRTIGIGPGQTSRVEAVRIAARRAGDEAKGAVMVSDAFFPFRDGIDAAHEIGITSIVQPGGSIRDQEVIDAANEYGMSMLFTGVRLFRH